MAGALGNSARVESSPLRAETTNVNSTTTNVNSTTETVINKIFSSSASLIKLLPTTTVLVFQVLSPTFTNAGSCYTANKYLTGFLIGLCGIFCSFDTFTDSYTASDGTLYYGIVTKTGLWTFNSTINKTVDLSSYKLTFLDFLHSLLSVLVFGAVALMDSNVVNCYYADARADAKQLVTNLPLGVGFVCTLIFIAFPTTRHGIGYAT
jgi:hypothetical protein